MEQSYYDSMDKTMDIRQSDRSKVTDLVDPLDLQYDRLGRPYIYSAEKGYEPTITYCNFEKYDGGYMTQYGHGDSAYWVIDKGPKE